MASTAPAQSVLRLDPALDGIIAPNATVETIAQGFQWSEAPVWRKQGAYLLFSDVPANTIYKWKQNEGLSIFLRPSGSSAALAVGRALEINGMTLDPSGLVAMADHGYRRVSRLNDSLLTQTTIAERYEGKRFNSPNDLVFHSSGDLYFTDPPFGLRGMNSDPAKELAFNGVFRVSRAGVVTLLARDLNLPNGIAFSPDERTLYVSNADARKPVWMAYPVDVDGAVGEGHVFFDASALMAAGARGVPDGMRVDRYGIVFATGPGGVLVLSPAGKHLGTIQTGRSASNCALGDDGSTLYITAGSRLMRVQLNASGARL